jgi:signal transduction histidine kinase
MHTSVMALDYFIIALLVACCAVLLDLYTRARQKARAVARQLVEANELVRQAAADAAKRDQLDIAKDEFISTVSHELRTPLTSIRGALGLLNATLPGHIDAKSQNLLRIASSNTDRLVRLINDILDLERMDSGRAPLQMHPCALREIVQVSVDTMSAMAQDAGIRLEVVPEAETIALEADPDRIQQVLCNLLSNAIKFSPAGSVVRVLTGIDGSFLILRIEDQGRGIPAAKLESVFDRFQQVEAGDARQKGGSGLGLAICRSILTQHGGTIVAIRNDSFNQQRSGTTFILRLPRIARVEDLLTVSAIYRRPRGTLASKAAARF